MPEHDRYVARARAQRIDGRLKLLLLIAACLTSQYLPALMLPLWLAMLMLLLVWGRVWSGQVRIMLTSGLSFIFFWLLMTAGSDLLLGKAWCSTLSEALTLGGRLLALTLTGIAFMHFSSPMETGRAAAWFFRPLLGKKAWKPALCIALTAWFLPMTLRLAGEVRMAMRARALSLPWHQRIFLLIGASLRILERKTEEIAVGLASRRLDDWRSWRM